MLGEKDACRVREWIGSDIVLVEQMSGGRNSQTYKVIAYDGQKYTLKKYYHHMSDPRDRMGTEFKSLSFLWNHGLRNIPCPIAMDRSSSCALYQFIEGTALQHEEVSENDISAACSFLEQLRKLRQSTRNDEFSSASEACFSLQELFSNLTSRRQRLSICSGPESNIQLLQDFFQLEYDTNYEILHEQALKLDWYNKILPYSHRMLSSSDFGFHNSIKKDDGTLVFLDFEYFGWDDPVKTLCDFLLHPAMQLNQKLKIAFASKFAQPFISEDVLFVERFKILFFFVRFEMVPHFTE